MRKALAAATSAFKWANTPEDTVVQDGNYSALHWARKGAAIYDAFDDRYLGAKSSDPTADNDGNALIVGALFFSTTGNVMKVYNGAAWQVQVPAASDYLAKAGGIMTGPLTSSVKDHGTLGAVTETYSYSDANVHTVTINGAHTINPANLVEGGVMMVNILYQSGSIAVSGTTQWSWAGRRNPRTSRT